jgi:hypothetical protein
MRTLEARPIPAIAVRMIRQLENLHMGLWQMGAVGGPASPLFCFPTQRKQGLIALVRCQMNTSLDIFCDYFETDRNEAGQRYYIRQHQLRRFFAMLFFWSNSFGGMDTLRWFLGHTDVEHLYHYITESTPGAVLRSVKAHYAAEQLATADPDATSLADLLERHFGTRNFSILDSNELDEYIEELMIEGIVEIEPEFFDSPAGKSYRVAIKVTPREPSA